MCASLMSRMWSSFEWIACDRIGTQVRWSALESDSHWSAGRPSSRLDWSVFYSGVCVETAVENVFLSSGGVRNSGNDVDQSLFARAQQKALRCRTRRLREEMALSPVRRYGNAVKWLVSLLVIAAVWRFGVYGVNWSSRNSVLALLMAIAVLAFCITFW